MIPTLIPFLSIICPIIAPHIIYPMPRGIIANKDSSNFSLGSNLLSIVSVMSVTKLPANVARLNEHHIIAGRIFRILTDIKSLKVFDIFSLKVGSTALFFTDDFTSYSSTVISFFSIKVEIVHDSLWFYCVTTNIVLPFYIPPLSTSITRELTFGFLMNKNIIHPPKLRALIAT